MPKYVEAYGQTIEFPDGMDDGAIEAALKKSSMDIPRPKGQGNSVLGNVFMGAARGAKDVIDTGAQGLASLYDKITGAGEGDRVRAMNDAGRQEFDAGYGGSTAASIGRIGGNVAATLPAGGVLGYGLRAAAPLAGAAAPVVSSLGNSIATGGMTTGNTLPALGNLAARVAGGGISGGASAGLVDPNSAALGAGIGAALPPIAMGAGRLGGAIRSGLVGNGVSPEVAQLAARAKELGIEVPADRLTDSRALNALAASLNYVPFSGRSAVEEGMTSGLNRALSNTFGQDSSNVTQALRNARPVLGQQFDDVLKKNAIRVDEKFVGDLAAAGERANAELGAEGAGIVRRQIADIESKIKDGVIDGQAAYNVKKTLDRIGQRNSPEAYYAKDVRNSLMGALDRSLGEADAAAFAQTRQQYGAMKSLERLAKNGAEGEVSVPRLANLGNINNPQIQELADIAAQFVRPRESQHGAAQRVFGALGSAGLGAGLMGGSALGAGVGLGGTVLAGRGASSLLNSDAARRYVMGQGLLGNVGPIPGLLGSGTYRIAPLLAADQ